VAVLLLVLPGSVAAAAESNVAPGINRHYQGADYERWVATFERSGREVYDQRHRIVAALRLKPGMTVADVGAGTGLFTRLFARAVGSTGRVYAVDITPEFISNILRTAREQELGNVEGIVNTATDTKLPSGVLDVVFVCDSYHHFEYPRAMLGSIQRALRANGALVVIDYEKAPGRSSPWVMDHVRADKATAIREIEAAGFRFVGEEPLLTENFFLRFVRR
jgi:ubiquinone/menaquinone biosynthesis C-methylase UbiE